jgi:uncharacterized membrane protein YeiH
MSSAATLVAITCAALAGSTAARRRGLDVVGVLSCAIITSLGGGLLGDVVVLRRVPQIFGGNTLTATCTAASAAVMIVAYRLQHPEAGLVGGTAIGGVLYLVARWRHWVLPSVERQRAETPVEASTASTQPTNLNTPTQLEES